MRHLTFIISGALLLALGFETAVAQSGSTAPDSVSTAVPTSVAPADTTPADTVATEVPQRDIFDVLSHDILHRPRKHKERHEGLHWALLPTFSYNTVYGFALGAMVAVAGQRGGEHSHYSSMRLGGNYSTEGQKQVYVRGDMFSPHERFLLQTDLRYLDTDRKTWGLGSFSTDQQKYPMSFILSRAYGTVYVRTVGQLFLGIGYNYDQFGDIVDERANKGEDTPFTDYSGGAVTKTVASGPSVNLLIDSRDNEVTPSSGCYLGTSYREYLTELGSDSDWTELWAELRLYTRLRHTERNVLGLWLYGWGTNDKPPYLNLPSSGWDLHGRGARGYVHGRIRGQDQLYAETEFRRTLTANGLLGAVVFVNAISTRATVSSDFESPDVGYGLGVRFRLNKHSRANLCVDHGWGLDGSQSTQMSMNEAF